MFYCAELLFYPNLGVFDSVYMAQPTDVKDMVICVIQVHRAHNITFMLLFLQQIRVRVLLIATIINLFQPSTINFTFSPCS
jgi:hypothetical protein